MSQIPLNYISYEKMLQRLNTDPTIGYWKSIGYYSRNEDTSYKIEPEKAISLATIITIQQNIEKWDYKATDLIFSKEDKEEILNLFQNLHLHEDQEGASLLFGSQLSFSNEIEPGFGMALALQNGRLACLDYKQLHRCIYYAQIKKDEDSQ